MKSSFWRSMYSKFYPLKTIYWQHDGNVIRPIMLPIKVAIIIPISISSHSVVLKWFVIDKWKIRILKCFPNVYPGFILSTYSSNRFLHRRLSFSKSKREIQLGIWGRGRGRGVLLAPNIFHPISYQK